MTYTVSSHEIMWYLPTIISLSGTKRYISVQTSAVTMTLFGIVAGLERSTLAN